MKPVTLLNQIFRISALIATIAISGCTSAQEPVNDIAQNAVNYFFEHEQSNSEKLSAEIANLESELGKSGLKETSNKRLRLYIELPGADEKTKIKLAEEIKVLDEQLRGTKNSKSQLIRNLAYKYYENGKNDKVAELLSDWDVRLKHPADSDYDEQELVDYAILYSKRQLGHNYDEFAKKAKSYLEIGIKFAPEYAELHKLMGDAHMEMHQPELAWDSFTEAIRLAPDNARYFLARARSLMPSTDAKQRDLFRKDLEKAKALDPKNYEVELAYAINSFANMEWDKCQEFIKRCLQKKPTRKRDLIAMLQSSMEIHFNKNEFENAVSFGQLLSKVDETNRIATTTIARSLVELKRFEEAAKAYGVAIENSGVFDTPEAVYYERGLVYKQLGLTEKMLKDFIKAKSLNKNIASKVDPDIRKAESEIRLTAATRAIEEAPADPQNYIQRAVEFRKQKRYSESVKDIKEAIALDSENSEFYYQLGLTHSWVDHKKAIAAYTNAIKLDAENWNAYNSRANSYRWMQNFDRALVDCTHVIESLAETKEPRFYETVQRAYLYRGHVKRLLQRDALPDYEAGRKAPGGLDRIISPWIRDFKTKKGCGVLEFELPLELNPNDIYTRLARVEKLLRFLEYDISKRARTGEFENHKTWSARKWANDDLDVVLRQEPEHSVATQLRKLLQDNKKESSRLGGMVRIPDDMHLLLKSIEDNWRRQRGINPRANK